MELRIEKVFGMERQRLYIEEDLGFGQLLREKIGGDLSRGSLEQSASSNRDNGSCEADDDFESAFNEKGSLTPESSELPADLQDTVYLN